MQSSKIVSHWLQENANSEHYLFLIKDLKALCPKLSNIAFKTVMSRMVKTGIIERVCRGLYAYKSSLYSNGLLLYHAAAYLRSKEFNYISLETVLSDVGVISQLPMNVISIMSSGRSSSISCGKFGRIEFIHTSHKPEKVMEQLIYDNNCRLWRAEVGLALKNMKRTRRNCDLIDWDIANEFIC